jgi:hypothetical protein
LYSNTTGTENVAVGIQALYSNQTGTGLTAVGRRALRFATANNNTALGALALYDCTSGTKNTAVGEGAGGGLTTGYNNTILGAGITLSSGTHDTIQIGTGDGTVSLSRDQNGNWCFGSMAASANVAGALALPNVPNEPNTSPAGGGQLYVFAGALKYRGSGGTVTTIGAA